MKKPTVITSPYPECHLCGTEGCPPGTHAAGKSLFGVMPMLFYAALMALAIAGHFWHHAPGESLTCYTVAKDSSGNVVWQREGPCLR